MSVSPSDAVELDEEATAEGHAAAEGVEPATTGDVGSERTVRQMLMSTDPGTPLDAVESPWNPEKGGMTRVMRAIQKATDVDGLPAVADLGIGLAEWWVSLDLGGDAESDEQADADAAPLGGAE